MNKANPTIGQLINASVAILILIGIPLFFWFILSSINSQPTPVGAPAAAETLPMETVEITVVFTPTPPPSPTPQATAVPTQAPTIPPQPIAEAAVSNITEPILVTDDPSPIRDSYHAISVTVNYTLEGYDAAMLIIEYSGVEGTGTSGHTIPIGPAVNAQMTHEYGLGDMYITEDGQLHPDLNFTTHINVYDYETEQYFNAYPGDIELSPHERNAPPPMLPADDLSLQALTVTTSDEAEPELHLSLATVLESASEGTVTAVISSADAMLSEEIAPVTQENSAPIISIPLANAPTDTPLNVTITLNVGEEIISKSTTFSIEELTAATPNSVWLHEVTAEEDGDGLWFTAVIGYQLDDPYIGGTINITRPSACPPQQVVAVDLVAAVVVLAVADPEAVVVDLAAVAEGLGAVVDPAVAVVGPPSYSPQAQDLQPLNLG